MSEPASTRWVSAGSLYWLLVGGSVLGVLLPAATIVLKYAAQDFRLWQQLVSENLVLADVLAAHRFLDIRESLPFLSRLSWHRPVRVGDTQYYAGYLVSNLALLGGLLWSRAKLVGWLTEVARWYHSAGHRYARRVILSAGLVVALTFQTKAYLGLWFAGIAGWTFYNPPPSLQDTPDYVSERRSVDPASAAGLRQALLPENAKYLPRGGYLSGRAMLLHFRDGAVLPGNYGLTRLVFPEYVFGSPYVEMTAPDVFFQVVKASYARRAAGRRFLLPASLAYPDHAAYMKLVECPCPSPDALETISLWKLTVHIDDRREVRIVDAIRTWTIRGD